MSERSFTIDVVVGPEDGEFCAVALQMGVRGYGASPQAALQALQETAAAHIEAAVQRKNLNLIFQDADEKYWDIFAKIRLESIKDHIRHRAHDAIKEGFEYRKIPIDDLLGDNVAA